MLTLDEAKGVANAFIACLGDRYGVELALFDNVQEEFEHGWLFYYNARAFVETHDEAHRLYGPVPLIVDKETGKVTETGPLPIGRYIDGYRPSGS